MKVLLLDDVSKLGWLGDVVDVTEGYARNYLIPQGIASVPSEANIKAIADEKARRAKERMKQRQLMEKAAEAINGAEVTIVTKANEQGHLFGSVSEKQIAEALREQGFELEDKAVKLSEHIKELGAWTVKLRYAEDVNAEVKVVVVSDQPTEEPGVTEVEEETEEAPSEEETA